MFIISSVVSIIFLIIKFIEMRFIEKENKPLKFLIRDAILVYFSVVCGFLIIEQVQPVMEDGFVSNSSTPVFTDNPGF